MCYCSGNFDDAGMDCDASGSKSAHASANVSMSSAEMSSPVAALLDEKLSRVTATSKLRITKHVTTWKPGEDLSPGPIVR